MGNGGIVVGFPQGSEMSLLSEVSRPTLGPTHPSQCVPGEKRQGRESDHSPPSSAEVKIEWSYISLPHVREWFAQEQPYPLPFASVARRKTLCPSEY
jgi:hypothetical protein